MKRVRDLPVYDGAASDKGKLAAERLDELQRRLAERLRRGCIRAQQLRGWQVPEHQVVFGDAA
jgi:hypothetical protein